LVATSLVATTSAPSSSLVTLQPCPVVPLGYNLFNHVHVHFPCFGYFPPQLNT
jgi:hypothetical protein